MGGGAKIQKYSETKNDYIFILFYPIKIKISICKETLSILTYAKSTITYNLKRVPLVLFITSKKLEKTNT